MTGVQPYQKGIVVYPSANLAFVLSDAIDMKRAAISLLKLEQVLERTEVTTQILIL